MRTHNLQERIRRAGLRVQQCKYRVVAVGLDSTGKVIGIRTNAPRLQARGWHAEERLMHKSPPCLRKVLVARLGASGRFLEIDPCPHCRKLAAGRGVEILRYAS